MNSLTFFNLQSGKIKIFSFLLAMLCMPFVNCSPGKDALKGIFNQLIRVQTDFAQKCKAGVGSEVLKKVTEAVLTNNNSEVEAILQDIQNMVTDSNIDQSLVNLTQQADALLNSAQNAGTQIEEVQTQIQQKLQTIFTKIQEAMKVVTESLQQVAVLETNLASQYERSGKKMLDELVDQSSMAVEKYTQIVQTVS